MNVLDPVTVTVTVQLTDAQAHAFGYFVRGINWAQIRQNACDDLEAYEMRDAVQQLQRAVSEAGYAPR